MAPDRAFAIQDDDQYRPVRSIGGQHVLVRDGAGTGLLMCHMSRPPGTPYGDGDRLVIVVHGALRDSGAYLGHAAAALAGSPALIVAPQFLADVDAGPGVPAEALYWSAEGWKGGRPALGPAPVSSFAAMDGLLERLTGPDLLAPGRALMVVIVGNSAGGQFVNRYAAVGRGPDALAERGFPVRFIVANPSTYLYFGPDRPVAVPDDGYVNRWRYGFDDPPPYVRCGPEESLRRYLERDVTVVLGRQDSDGAALLLEVSPPAMAQGANRFERGLNYDAHVRGLARAAGLTAGHRLIQLDGVGHAARDVLTAAPTRDLLFS